MFPNNKGVTSIDISEEVQVNAENIIQLNKKKPCLCFHKCSKFLLWNGTLMAQIAINYAISVNGVPVGRRVFVMINHSEEKFKLSICWWTT